jgi:hypothetical protein
VLAKDDDRLFVLPARFRHPDILFVVRRTLNENLCVYQLNRRRQGQGRERERTRGGDGNEMATSQVMALVEKENVLVYWVDLQNPKSRASDRRWKRVELNAVETRLAYGVTSHGLQQTAASSAGSGDEASSLMSVDFSIRAIESRRV